MSVELGGQAPDFIQESTAGLIQFHEWLGDSWGILFSHPADFTPVCTTELGAAAKLKSEFDRRNVKIIGLSVDTLISHQKWIDDINRTQNTKINFPLLADDNRLVSKLYGMIHPGASDTATVRAVFIVDPEKIIRLIMIYPQSTGRDFNEILRTIDSLQLTSDYCVATPANWKNGDDCVILPSIHDPKELEQRFPKGWNEVRPYLLMTRQPNLD